MNWLIRISDDYQLEALSLHITVSIIDRVLMKWDNFKSSDLYILGIASLIIANKYNESGKVSVDRLIIETATSFI